MPPSKGGERAWVFGAKIAERDYYRALLEHSVLRSLAFVDGQVDEEERFPYAGKECSRVSPFALAREGRERPYDVVLTEYSEADVWSFRSHYLPEASIVANTHAMSMQESLVRIGTCLTWNLYRPFDAIVCSSETARTTVSAMFAHLKDKLQRAGLRRRFQLPRLELIPFGVDLPKGPPVRERARKALGFSKDDVVILSFGRLSHVNKADLMAMLVPLARVAKRAKPLSVKVVIAGNDSLGLSNILRKLGAGLGLDERVLSVVSDPPHEMRERLYAASDVFISLADNIQETFGLTILEAMAHGLPVIASDWGGYRDLVRDGENGILVPTAWSSDFADLDVLSGLRAVHQHDISHRIARQTAVDVEQTESALLTLTRNLPLRQEMSARAREHVRGRFAWSSVAKQHVALWADLRARVPERGVRRLPLERIPATHAHATIFGHYPTELIHDRDRIALHSDARTRSSKNPLLPFLDKRGRANLKALLEVIGRRETSIKRCILEAQELAMTPKAARESLILAIKYGLVVRTQEKRTSASKREST